MQERLQPCRLQLATSARLTFGPEQPCSHAKVSPTECLNFVQHSPGFCPSPMPDVPELPELPQPELADLTESLLVDVLGDEMTMV